MKRWLSLYLTLALTFLPAFASAQVIPVSPADVIKSVEQIENILPGFGALNLGKRVDDVAGAADVIVGIGAVRDDVLTTLVPADGDYVRLRTDSVGALWVNVLSGGAGTEFAEDSVAADASLGNVPLTVRQDVDGSSSAGTDGDFAFLFTDSRGFLKAEVFTGGDTFAISAASLPLPTGAATEATLATIDADTSTLAGAVSGTEFQVDILSLIPGVGATNLGKAEDAVHSSGDTGVPAWAVANPDLSITFAASGDYLPVAASTRGVVLSAPVFDGTLSTTISVMSIEDAAMALGGIAGMRTLVLRDDALSAGAGTGADGDATFHRVDNFGAGWAALSADDGARLPADSTSGLLVNLGANNDVSLNAGSNNIGDVDLASAIPAGSNLIGKVQPFDAVVEGGLTELIGINEAAIATGQFSDEVSVALAATSSGEILEICAYQTEDGTGAILSDLDLRLFIFDADPATTVADPDLTAAAAVTILGTVSFGNADFYIDANSAVRCEVVAIPFHSLASLFFAVESLGATSINSAAGDDEQVEFNFWYRRDS